MSASRVAQVSDLHFGRHDESLVDALLVALSADAPDLVVVSGDFTQRARRAQYEAARRWLEQAPGPVLALPGNHDIPMFDVFRRATDPYGRYRGAISDDLDGAWRGPGALVAAVSSASARRRAEGRVRSRQVSWLRRLLAEPAAPRTTALVTHHPLVAHPGLPEPRRVRGSGPLLEAAEEGRVDLLLSGHLHVSGEGSWLVEGAGGRTMVAAWAPTALSTRRRGEANGYSLHVLSPDRMEIAPRRWDGTTYAPLPHATWVRGERGWEAEATPAPGPASSPAA